MSDRWPYAPPRRDLLIIVDDILPPATTRRAAELLRGVYDKVEVVEVRHGAFHHEDLLTMLGRHPGSPIATIPPHHGRSALLAALERQPLVLDAMNAFIPFKPPALNIFKHFAPELRYKTILAIAAVIRGARA